MHFQYIARSTSGQTTSGMIEAESLSDARTRLKEEGLFALGFGAVSSESSIARRIRARLSMTGVTKTDLLMFTSQLTIMSQTGVDLAEALRNLADQCPNPSLKRALDEVYEDVSSGKPVAAALRKQSNIFGEAYVASIAAAEASGSMTEVLTRLAELLRNEIRLRASVRSVLAYPIVLGSVAMLVIGALVFFVLPQFAKVFADIGKPAPPMTQFLLDSATIVRSHFLIVLASFSIVLLSIVRFWFTETGVGYWDGLTLNGMFIKKATQPLFLGRLFRLLGTMIQSGVPLLESLQLCGSAVRNRHYRALFASLEEDVVNGEGVAKALVAAKFVPAGAAQMVATAEKTGRLGPVLGSVGEFYEDEGEREVRQLAKLLEPAIIVVMGVVVAFVVLSIMLPLLDVSTMGN